MVRLSLLPLALLALVVICGQLQAQTNSPATGAPAVTAADGTDLTMLSESAIGPGIGPNEDSQLTATKGSITDPDGIATFTPTWAWQQAVAPASGAPAAGDYSAIAGATASTFTPLQVHVGQFLRVCATFDDDAGNSETRCRGIGTVVNVIDRPVGGDSNVNVPDIASSADPYLFTRADFPFSDEDGHALNGIYVVSAPARGTLTLVVDGLPPSTDCTANSRCVRANNFLNITQVDSLAYYPDANPTVGAGYATFTYRVRDDGGRSSRADEAADAATLTINITDSSVQVAASGNPTPYSVVGTPYDQNTELIASTRGITEPNGIDADTLRWEWQSSVSGNDPFAAISGASGDRFTPRQAHVNLYIRVCASFRDRHPTAETVEGPLCSVATRVNDINFAPTCADASVNVSIAATATNPYFFKVSDFPFMDEDGDKLAILNIAAPDKGTLHLEGGSRPISRGTRIPTSSVPRLTYYPPEGNHDVTPNFATFPFRVIDGTGSADSEECTMTINLVERLRLRLRLFLEGPLR